MRDLGHPQFERTLQNAAVKVPGFGLAFWDEDLWLTQH
jgi:hypothetical protein